MNSATDQPNAEELASLLPQYRFEYVIAEGGMGTVYRAEQISLGRPVAIKILPRGLGADAAYREQFQSEARLMAALNHPHIVNIHDFGEAGGLFYIIMEMLDGTNLLQRMGAEPLKQMDVVRILTQVCDALTAAHGKGVIHRDVKPENVFIDSGLRVKLGDFGIARMRRKGEDDPQDLRLGTPEYAAPELFDPQKPVDHRADVFSLGVVLYEMLTGARPTGSFIAPSRRKPGVDKRFDDVVIRAMQSNPANRYASAEDMKKDLLRVLQQPVGQKAPTAGKSAAGPAGQRQTPAAAPRTGGPAPLPASSAKPKAPPSAEAEPKPAKTKSAKTKSKTKAAEAGGPKPARSKSPALLWGGVGTAAAIGIALPFVINKGDKGGTGGGAAADKKGAAGVIAALEERASRPPSRDPEPQKDPKPGPKPEPKPEPPAEPGPPAKKLVYAGHVYQLIPSRLTWREAQKDAEKSGGHLATVTTQEEHDALLAYLKPLLKREKDRCWLGATDGETDGQWKWVTGEAFSFTAWGSDAPSGRAGEAFLSWQKRSKYSSPGLGWNDMESDDHNGSAISGSLVEWDSETADAGR